MPERDLHWPEAVMSLRRELVEQPGRLALITGSGADGTASVVAEVWGVPVTSVGRSLTEPDTVPTASQVMERLRDAEALIECEVLFWGEFPIDPVGLFRQLSRTAPRVFVWPGEIQARNASFSQLGRPDRYEAQLADTIVLRAREPRFPDVRSRVFEGTGLRPTPVFGAPREAVGGSHIVQLGPLISLLFVLGREERREHHGELRSVDPSVSDEDGLEHGVPGEPAAHVIEPGVSSAWTVVTLRDGI